MAKLDLAPERSLGILLARSMRQRGRHRAVYVQVHVMLMYMQVAYARGHWQRPVWQGRFAGTVPAGSDDDSLVITWLLLERRPVQSPRSLDLEEDAKGAARPPCLRSPSHLARGLAVGHTGKSSLTPYTECRLRADTYSDV